MKDLFLRIWERFNKRYQQGISKGIISQQTSVKISNNNIKIQNVQFPIVKNVNNNRSIK